MQKAPIMEISVHQNSKKKKRLKLNITRCISVERNGAINSDGLSKVNIAFYKITEPLRALSLVDRFV